jgi:hypothetical protein
MFVQLLSVVGIKGMKELGCRLTTQRHTHTHIPVEAPQRRKGRTILLLLLELETLDITVLLEL